MHAHFADKLYLLESGMSVFQDANVHGLEYPLYFRSRGALPRIDILAVDANGGFVVIECKIQSAKSCAVGQVAGYVSWLRDRFPIGNVTVRAFIVCKNVTPMLWYAMREVTGIEFTVFEYDDLDTVRRLDPPPTTPTQRRFAL